MEKNIKKIKQYNKRKSKKNSKPYNKYYLHIYTYNNRNKFKGLSKRWIIKNMCFFLLIILIGILSISFASANENMVLNENTQSNIEELSLDSTTTDLILNENNENTYIETNEKTKLTTKTTY